MPEARRSSRNGSMRPLMLFGLGRLCATNGAIRNPNERGRRPESSTWRGIWPAIGATSSQTTAPPTTVRCG